MRGWRDDHNLHAALPLRRLRPSVPATPATGCRGGLRLAGLHDGFRHAGPGQAAGRRLGRGKPKRVSFKGDNLPPPSPPPPPAVELDENGLPIPGPGDAGSCSYMHFDNYMDYQVGGGLWGMYKGLN